MSYFTINISKLNNSIEGYKNTRTDLNDDLSSIYESLKNTDAGWMDNNSVAFMNVLKNDKFDIDNYLSDMDRLYKQIESFKDDIDTIVNRYGFKKNTVTLKFDGTKIDRILSKLQGTLTYLNNTLYYVDLCNFDSSFSAYYRVKKLKTEIKSIRVLVNNVISEIKKFKKSIDTVILDHQVEFPRVVGFDLNIEPLEYIWSLNSPELKDVELNDNKTFTTSRRTIDAVRETSSNNAVTAALSSEKTIDFDSGEASELETNFVSHSVKDIDAIKMNDTAMDKIMYTTDESKVLNTNVDFVETNTVDYIKSDYVKNDINGINNFTSGVKEHTMSNYSMGADSSINKIGSEVSYTKSDYSINADTSMNKIDNQVAYTKDDYNISVNNGINQINNQSSLNKQDYNATNSTLNVNGTSQSDINKSDYNVASSNINVVNNNVNLNQVSDVHANTNASMNVSTNNTSMSVNEVHVGTSSNMNIDSSNVDLSSGVNKYEASGASMNVETHNTSISAGSSYEVGNTSKMSDISNTSIDMNVNKYEGINITDNN